MRIWPQGRIGYKLVLSFVLLVMVVVGGSGWVLYELTERSLEQQMSEHLIAVAQLVATGPNGGVLRMLRPGYENFNLYQSLTARLRREQELVGARRIYVFDRKGRSLLDTERSVPIGREYTWLRIQDSFEMLQILQGQSTHTVPFTEGGVEYMRGYAPIFDGDEVVAGVGVDIGAGFTGTIAVFKQSVFIFAGIGVLLTIVVGFGLAGTITRPVQRLVGAARQIGRGNLEYGMDTSGQDELGYLAAAMDEMRLKLLTRDAQLRQMLGGVAHEIRNPLGGIEIYAGLIADDLPDEDPRKQHIQKVIAEVRTLNRVIAEFLDFARPAPPVPESVSVGGLVEDAAFLLAPEMEEGGIEYRHQVDPDLYVWADPEQVKRALFNLMRNGIQAMRGGGVLQVRAQRVQGEAVLEVIDDGPGIGAEVQGHLFEPFFTTKEKGSGLGLAILRQTLEQNGGRVELQSAAGQGATFRIFLPDRKERN